MIHPQTYDLKQKYLFTIHNNLFSTYILISKANSLILTSVSSSGVGGEGGHIVLKTSTCFKMKNGPKPSSTVYSYLCTELKGLNFWLMAI